MGTCGSPTDVLSGNVTLKGSQGGQQFLGVILYFLAAVMYALTHLEITVREVLWTWLNCQKDNLNQLDVICSTQTDYDGWHLIHAILSLVDFRSWAEGKEGGSPPGQSRKPLGWYKTLSWQRTLFLTLAWPMFWILGMFLSMLGAP